MFTDAVIVFRWIRKAGYNDEVAASGDMHSSVRVQGPITHDAFNQIVEKIEKDLIEKMRRDDPELDPDLIEVVVLNVIILCMLGDPSDGLPKRVY